MPSPASDPYDLNLDLTIKSEPNPSSSTNSVAPSHPFFDPIVSNPAHLLNGGIAPGLTGGHPTPPAEPSHQLAPSSTNSITIPALPQHDSLPSLPSPPSLSKPSKPAALTKAASVQDETPAAKDDLPDGASTPATGATSLVAKDAIVASTIISSVAVPAKTGFGGGFQMLVLGVPASGAKSRVETQIKISLVLVQPKQLSGGRAVQARADLAGELTTLDGGLDGQAGEHLERIGSWSHVRLPHYLALKRKTKKQTKPDPPTDDTLLLDVKVVRGTDPTEEIFICTGCQAREHKRAQRKKEARVRPPADLGEPPLLEDEERRKVVVFNCPEFVDFVGGETILPTRITCYCRHHKEKKGFSVAFSLRTAAGEVVASGATPPIMITDDHKTSSTRPGAADQSIDGVDPRTLPPPPSAAPTPKPQSVAPPTPLSLPQPNSAEEDSAMQIEPSPSQAVKSKRGKPSKKEKAGKHSGRESNASEAGSVAGPNSKRTKRTSGKSKSTRGQVDSNGEEDPLVAALNGSANMKKTKPYDRRRPSSNNAHRSPTFAMTPLYPATQPSGSPASQRAASLAPSPMTNLLFDTLGAGPGPAQPDQWESALGLGGMDDHLMQDQNNQDSNATSPAGQDWRSSASSPPFSPGSATTNDTFQSFLNTLSSPNMSRSNNQSIASPPADPAQFGLFDGQDPQAFTLGAGAGSMAWTFPQSSAAAPPPAPRISRLIPGEGPVHGGIEVTVLGENFVRDLVCVFGDSPAVPTHFWSSNTLVCILPPAANPGPVVVGIKGVPLTVEQGNGLQLFTYKDDSDRSLLELALQVVGLKMTGRLEDASAVAMRIVGNGTNAGGAGAGPSATVSPGQTTHANTRATDPHQLAQSLNAAASAAGTFPFAGGETRNFEGIVIKFLSLLDLHPSQIPGAAPSIPLSRPAISLLNAQRHSLLHLAAVLGFHRLVQFLLARSIGVNHSDRNGYTALHFAALYGRVAITRMLLEAGAKAEMTNLAGQTALDIATDRDDVDVEDVLLRHRSGAATPNPGAAWSRRPSSLSVGSPRSSLEESSSSADESEFQTHEWSSGPSWTSDYSEDDSEDDSEEDDDDISFHSSDEESIASHVERRLSRNASQVSLHYLLEAEEDADSVYDGHDHDSIANAEVVTDVDEGRPEGSRVEHNPPTPTNQLAWATPHWLGKALKPVVAPFPHKLHVPTQAQMSGVWEKAKQTGFALPPLQMPELAAFRIDNMPAFSKGWRRGEAGKADGHGTEGEGAVTTESDGEATVVASSPDMRGGGVDGRHNWRALYSGPWWHPAKGSGSFVPCTPPPVYSPNAMELLQQQPSSSGSGSTTPKASAKPLPAVTVAAVGVAAPAQPATIQARIQRRVEHVQEEISDSVLQSYLHHERTIRNLKDDRMLFFFWIPVLLVVLGFAVWNGWAAVEGAVVDGLLPARVLRMIRA